MVRWRAGTWMLALAMGAMALSGCGRSVGESHLAVGSSPARAGPHGVANGSGADGRDNPASRPTCAAPFRSGLAARRLPVTFKVAAVYECQEETETIPGRGVWQVVIERRSTADLDAFAAALRRPKTPAPTAGVACPLARFSLPRLVVVSASGRVLEPAVPTDECGDPQTAILRALDHLVWKTISDRLVTQTETQRELATGCGPAYKNLFALYASQLQPAKTGPVFAPTPTKLTVCVFRNGHGSNSQIGRFIRGATISGRSETAVLDGISRGRTTTGCAHPDSTFAMLGYSADRSTVAVELGGCDRVLHTDVTIEKARQVAVEHDEIGQASPAAVRIIERIGR